MKKFVITILLFLSPILICMGVLENGMRSIPNDYAFKNSWLEKNISHVHIWSLGSSHGLYGISPRYFSKPAFNSAHVSQSLKYDKFIFDKYINKADSLEWLILPISYFSLVSELEDGIESWRIKNYCIYYNCPYYPLQPKYHFEISSNPLSYLDQIGRVYKYWRTGDDFVNSDAWGLSMDYSKEKRKDNWYNDGEKRAKLHTEDLSINQSIIGNNINIMESIIRTCADMNVSVLLLTTPVCSTYFNCVDSAQYALMVHTCENFQEKYDNVLYLNLFRDARFTKDDFFDSDHLETEGAAKLTRVLDEYIKQLN